MNHQYILNGLHCANCAQKIQSEIQKELHIKEVHLDFVTKKLTLTTEETVKPESLFDQMVSLVHKFEPDVHVLPVKQSFDSEIVYILSSLKCADCANKIEKTLSENPAFSSVNLDFISKKLYVSPHSNESSGVSIDQEVIRTVHKFEPDISVSRFYNAQNNNEFLQAQSGTSYKKFFLFGGLGLFILGIFLPLTKLFFIALHLVAYVLVGHSVIRNSLKGLKSGQIFDENFLMTVATIGALGLGEWREAVAVMLFYEVGEAFQERAVDKSRRSIQNLLDIKPDSAHLIDGLSISTVHPESILAGQMILVKPGEKVPLDGVVKKGTSTLDTSALTGESMPRLIEPGQSVLSGSVNLQGTLTVEVSKPFHDSTVARILKLVEHSAAKKSHTEKFITRFARYYTPAVVFSALALAILPPLLTGAHWGEWIEKALIFLVVSCPCALVVSIPLGYFGGIGAASRKGILIKGGQYLDALEKLDTVVFDKTGTLTTGTFEVTGVYPTDQNTKQDVLKWAQLAESQSNHPIALSILKAAEKSTPVNLPSVQTKEIPGQGVCAQVEGKTIYAGNDRLMTEQNISLDAAQSQIKKGTVIYIAVDKILKGWIEIADLPKSEAHDTLKKLKDQGISYIEMLTGDSTNAAQLVSDSLPLDDFKAELLPEDKVTAVDALIKKGRKLAFVGDGVNDAPVLARANVGIAMGALGSDAAIEAADVVLMTDELSKISEAVSLSKFTRRIIIQNIVLALGVKFAVMGLGVFGIATMWMAVFSDVGVAILAVFNSMRILRA